MTNSASKPPLPLRKSPWPPVPTILLVEALISQSLPRHQRQLAFAEAFPQNGIAAVISASTSENTEQATDALALRLARSPDFFRAVVQPDSGAFFEQHGLLFDTLVDVKKSIGGLSKAQFLITELACPCRKLKPTGN